MKATHTLFLYIIFFLLFSNSKASASSWKEIRANKKGTIVKHYYNSDNFISDAKGKLEGIEYDLFNEFFSFLEYTYEIQLIPVFKKAESFSALYENILKGHSGEFGACSFSITEKRLKEVAFSPRYMPDIEVLICSNNFPVVSDTQEFIRFFKNSTALNVPNTTFEHDINILKNVIPGLKIENVALASAIRSRIANERGLFSYIELPNYFISLKKGERLKRQNMFKVERAGYAIIYPLSSDWNAPVEAFFNSKDFKFKMNDILHKHLGEDVKDLVLDVASDKNPTSNKEIALLTKEREIQSLEIEKNELELSRQRIIKNVLIASGILFLLIAFLVYNRYRIKKEANKMLARQNDEIKRQRDEIAIQRDNINFQKSIIEEKHQSITDSINYAKLIQDALLPEPDSLKEFFDDYFIIYRPRDIVSGDFYWTSSLVTSGGGRGVILALADCTGHGVPGAFMSMMGYNFLGQIITDKKITDPASVLQELNKMISNTLQGKNKSHKANDGMDIVLCAIDLQSLKMDVAASMNSMFICRKGEVKEIKGDRFSIGGRDGAEKKIQTHEIELKRGDLIYMTTDGFRDQFGGPQPPSISPQIGGEKSPPVSQLEGGGAGKKFKMSQFKELIQKYHSLTLANQQTEFMLAFENWMKGYEQIDDVCVIGLRI